MSSNNLSAHNSTSNHKTLTLPISITHLISPHDVKPNPVPEIMSCSNPMHMQQWQPLSAQNLPCRPSPSPTRLRKTKQGPEGPDRHCCSRSSKMRLIRAGNCDATMSSPRERENGEVGKLANQERKQESRVHAQYPIHSLPNQLIAYIPKVGILACNR
jgi:hypothetical protein